MPSEAISACSAIVHAATSRTRASASASLGEPSNSLKKPSAAAIVQAEVRLAQPGDLRGKKTKLAVCKKWLDIGTLLEHDFTRG